jgi:hypothetical protein
LHAIYACYFLTTPEDVQKVLKSYSSKSFVWFVRQVEDYSKFFILLWIHGVIKGEMRRPSLEKLGEGRGGVEEY